MSKIVLFQTILFSISTQFSSIWPIDRTLSGATTPGQSGPGSDGNEGVLCIPQRLFSVLSRTLIGGVLPLCRDAIGVIYSPNWLGNIIRWKTLSTPVGWVGTIFVIIVLHTPMEQLTLERLFSVFLIYQYHS